MFQALPWLGGVPVCQLKITSRFIGELLHQHMRTQTTYKDAMRRYLARTPTALKDTGPSPAREDLHDRAGLR